MDCANRIFVGFLFRPLAETFISRFGQSRSGRADEHLPLRDPHAAASLGAENRLALPCVRGALGVGVVRLAVSGVLVLGFLHSVVVTISRLDRQGMG
jgi:hypothetical protein